MIELVVSGSRVLPTVMVVGNAIRIVMNLDDDLHEIIREHGDEIVDAVEYFAWCLFADVDVERDFESNTSEFIVRFTERNS